MYTLEPTPYQVSKEVAKRYRIIRKQLNISQKEMAERSGVSLGSLKRFENTGKISFESLLKLIHLLGRITDFDNILLAKENRGDIEKLFTK